MHSHDPETDAALGITRCARCGQKLDGEIECPVCTGYYEAGHAPSPQAHKFPKWIYLTACFMAFPLSALWYPASGRLALREKALITALGTLWLLTLGALIG